MKCDIERPERIAIIHPVSAPWVARILDGIHQYAREQGGWHIFLIPPSAYGAEKSIRSLRSMQGWKGDGMLVATNNPDELRYVRQRGIPVVNLASGIEERHGVPRVSVDNHAAGRLAAWHLLERGLTNLAYFGWEELWYSELRCRGFRERAAESGVECRVLLRPWEDERELNWAQRMAVPARWLASLPLPCGIFAAQDFKAQLLLDACNEAGLRVPDDIAIIGMDNNETICEHSVPQLSSISRNSPRVGYEAAALLDRIIHGDPCSGLDILVPPDEVVVRASSDMMYCSDPLVRRAIEYMRLHIRKSYNIEVIADQLGISKRKLERRFAEAANRSPHQYLTHLRVMHAKAVMKLNPGMAIETVAAECGFGSATTFCAAFQRITGEAPSVFRKQSGGEENVRLGVAGPYS